MKNTVFKKVTLSVMMTMVFGTVALTSDGAQAQGQQIKIPGITTNQDRFNQRSGVGGNEAPNIGQQAAPSYQETNDDNSAHEMQGGPSSIEEGIAAAQNRGLADVRRNVTPDSNYSVQATQNESVPALKDDENKKNFYTRQETRDPVRRISISDVNKDSIYEAQAIGNEKLMSEYSKFRAQAEQNKRPVVIKAP